MPLPVARPKLDRKPVDEAQRRQLAARAIRAASQGEEVPFYYPPADDPAPAAGQTLRLAFERAGVVFSPVQPGDAQFYAMLDAFQQGRSTPLLADLIALAQGIAASRTVPSRAHPESGAEGK